MRNENIFIFRMLAGMLLFGIVDALLWHITGSPYFYLGLIIGFNPPAIIGGLAWPVMEVNHQKYKRRKAAWLAKQPTPDLIPYR